MSTLSRVIVAPSSNLVLQFARYLVVGGVAFVVDFLLLVLLAKLLGLNYLLAGVVGFIGGLIVNYRLSVWWVFQNHTLQDKRVEFGLFALIGVIGLGLNEIILYLGTGVIGLDVSLSKLISVALVLFWNFGARRATLFRAPSPS
jgi:putative flippase GtrA